MTLRPDNRLADVPMTPVRCGRCTSQVLVRKSSWDQTSVQWNAAAVRGCEERSHVERVAGRGRVEPFLACAALGESIVEAARHGELVVVDEASQ